MRVYGLTGNIASGKSTVARIFSASGVPVVDADKVAREVALPGKPALEEIAQRFPGVLAPDGSLDRKALAARVFTDAAERAALNQIMHPRIAAEVAARLAALAASGEPFAIYEAALLVENGLHRPGLGLDGLIVVTAPVDEQVRRIGVRDGLSEPEARARIAAQLPAAEKVAHADFVVANAGSAEALILEVRPVLRALEAGYRRAPGVGQ